MTPRKDTKGGAGSRPAAAKPAAVAAPRPTTAATIDTYARNTWCVGCGNFGLLNAVRHVLPSLVADGIPPEKLVVLTGIGCHGKIGDYLGTNTVVSLHGRALAMATGVKLAAPDLTVIAHVGDGDSYAEGIEHLLFAAKRNVDITVVVHHNGVYGLTTGQSSPTAPRGSKGRATPSGTHEDPFNPLELLLAAGATFLARGYTRGGPHLEEMLRRAVLHRGFALVDVLQVCFTFNNLYDHYNEAVYRLEDHDPSDREAALRVIREWGYRPDAPIATGVFWDVERETFDESYRRVPLGSAKRKKAVAEVIDGRL
jgi:2-oxoglutarate ferredoxin oxidoreductase subunit beta